MPVGFNEYIYFIGCFLEDLILLLLKSVGI